MVGYRCIIVVMDFPAILHLYGNCNTRKVVQQLCKRSGKTAASPPLFPDPPAKNPSNPLPPIHLQINPSNKSPFIARQEQRRIRNIHRICQPPQRDGAHELLDVLGRKRNAHEGLEEACAGEQGADCVDADLVLAVFGG